jgi:hypothetical protein
MDVDKMEAGRELDLLIAVKVMGGRLDGDSYTDGSRCWPVPPYSTDLAAAWKVWEKFQHQSKRLHYVFPDNAEEGHYEVLWSHGPQSSRSGMSLNRKGEVWAEGETAPLAICRAALRAVGT